MFFLTGYFLDSGVGTVTQTERKQRELRKWWDDICERNEQKNRRRRDEETVNSFPVKKEYAKNYIKTITNDIGFM